MDCMVAYVNGVVKELSAAPVLADGSAMIPLRFVSEYFDCEVSYVESTRSIYINN
ncbi:MAG: copper amine oxidase N-terminal domain-containing protein [Clostridiales bacterium]|nr:copper amine oxidase N-terminal domain-containing protein [Clostridiales bacterium]